MLNEFLKHKQTTTEPAGFGLYIAGLAASEQVKAIQSALADFDLLVHAGEHVEEDSLMLYLSSSTPKDA